MHQRLSPRFSWKGIPARRQPNAPQIRCKVDAIQTPMWMRGPSWLAEFMSSFSGAVIIASSTWVIQEEQNVTNSFHFSGLFSAKKQQRKLAKHAVKSSLPKESPAPTAKLKPSVLIKRQEPVKLRGKSYPRLEIIPCLGHLRSSVSE